MKKIFKSILTAILTLTTLFSITGLTAHAITPLDEIQKYYITVNVRPDGTMDIKYEISWKVLDDQTEGMLEWVKIGIPNSHVDTITPLSSNIKKAGYMSDSGDFVKIDFDRKYERNEIVNFEFSIHQSYMYTVNNDSSTCRFVFTPGWFEEIEVKDITIKWADQNVIESDCHTQDDGYLIWNKSLGMGERITVRVKYDLESLTVDPDKQFETRSTPSSSSSDSESISWVWIVVIIVIVILFIILYLYDDYGGSSGFGGGGGGYRSSCVRSSCVHSCACACACAGGGRAGCTKKDFYGAKHLKRSDLEKTFEDKPMNFFDWVMSKIRKKE